MSGDHNLYQKWRESEAYAVPMTPDGVKWSQERWRGFNTGYKQAVWECIKQLEIGKKGDPYTGSLFTCDHNDNIDYQIEVLKQHFELELPEKFQTHVHASDTSSERVNKTEKSEHEDWYGQWQWRCGYEQGWDKAMEHVEAKLKEKNNG